MEVADDVGLGMLMLQEAKEEINSMEFWPDDGRVQCNLAV
jgi:hypothetical protein|tara:strand:+ start:189 stop:308 length:120 start_codon:yes stop_codon:yes gene_type:complete